MKIMNALRYFILFFSIITLVCIASGKQSELPEEVISRGEKLIDKKKFAQALALIMPYAKSGNPDAQFSAGVIILSGKTKLPKEHLGLTSDRLGLCWIEMAAAQGNIEACILLTDAYKVGKYGVEKNAQMAAFWRKMAEENERKNESRNASVSQPHEKPKKYQDLAISADLLPYRLEGVTDFLGWEIHIYIENTSSKTILLPRKKDWSSQSYEKIRFNIMPEETKSGRILKPSAKDLDLIELTPNEITKITVITVRHRANEKFRKEIVYAVSEEMKAFYPVWTGRVSVIIESEGVKKEKKSAEVPCFLQSAEPTPINPSLMNPIRGKTNESKKNETQ
jgi:hypothetical protein